MTDKELKQVSKQARIQVAKGASVNAKHTYKLFNIRLCSILGRIKDRIQGLVNGGHLRWLIK